MEQDIANINLNISKTNNEIYNMQHSEIIFIGKNCLNKIQINYNHNIIFKNYL